MYARMVLVLVALIAQFCFASDDGRPVIGSTFVARDSLAPPSDSLSDAQACVDGLCWKPADFEVTLQEADKGRGDLLVRFPSATPSGNAQNDLVAMEWYQAKDANKNPIVAPAAIIVHESGSGMTVGRLIAAGLRKKGVHTFMIQLPYYGKRRGPEGKPTGQAVFTAMKQSIADVRRAKDAISVLSLVDKSRISVQGTSLGGFVTSTTASVDGCFHRVFILLSGGDIHGVIASGKKDAAKLRQELSEAGIDSDQLRMLLSHVEPLRVAHRLDPSRTWLFSGEFDDVVPLENAKLLAKAIGLDEEHHVIMLADHYSGVLLLPSVIQQMYERMIESD